MAEAIFLLGLIFFLAFVFLALFDRARVPDVLLLILVGVVLGPYVLHVAHPADFGRVGAVLSTVALIVVLLLGGIELDLHSLATALRPTLLLTTACFALTMAIVAAVGVAWLGLHWYMAVTMGAILGGTSSAVVIPLIKALGLPEYPATILTLESALTDVLTVVLSTSLMQAAASQAVAVRPGLLVGSLASSMVMASIFGVAGGLAWLAAIRVAPRSQDFVMATVAFSFLVFGVAEGLGFNGGIAVLVLGLTLGNRDRMRLDRIPVLRELKLGSLTRVEHGANRQAQFLLKLFFFVYLGISIPFRDWRLAVAAAVTVLAVYAARHLLVLVTVDRKRIEWGHAAALCALAPKGLAAAVLAGQPRLLGLSGGQVIEDFSYMVVLISIAVTALLIPAVRFERVRSLYRAMAGAPTDAPVPEVAAT